MCGIAGIYHLNHITNQDYDQTLSMLDMIKHRGPDGADIHFSKDICIASVRLAMVDSISNFSLIQDQNLILAYNGEIYNYHELKHVLEQKGYKFKTKSDGEVILYLYKEKGLNLFDSLDGMYAFALFDSQKRSLLLVRDPLGIKPLYYSINNSKICFASEIKSFLAKDKPSLNPVALTNYYNYRFIPAPKTIYREIFKLEPGQFLFAYDNDVIMKKFWTPSFIHQQKLENQDHLLKDMLEQAVISTYNCDHNLGIFLSGGLDSNAILALLKKNFYKPEAFTIYYDLGNRENENKEASILTSNLNINHKLFELKSSDLLKNLNRTAWFIDEPIYSTVAVSTYALSSYAADYVKGVLTGDGADELFLSYEYLQRVASIAKDPSLDLKSHYLNEIGWIEDKWKNHLLRKDFLELYKQDDIFFEDNLSNEDYLNSIRKFEISYRLPEYHLARVDRLTMAHGIEARVPFLRKTLVEWSLKKSTSDFLYKNPRKHTLKESLLYYLPKSIFLKKKQPFTTPIYEWIKSSLNSDIKSILLESNYHQDLGLNNQKFKSFTTDFFKEKNNEYMIIWGMYMIFKWYENVINFKNHSN